MAAKRRIPLTGVDLAEADTRSRRPMPNPRSPEWEEDRAWLEELAIRYGVSELRARFYWTRANADSPVEAWFEVTEGDGPKDDANGGR